MKYIIKNKANKKGAAIKRCLYFLLSLISLTLKFYYFIAAVGSFLKVSLKTWLFSLNVTDKSQLLALLNVNEALYDGTSVLLVVNVYFWTSSFFLVSQFSVVNVMTVELIVVVIVPSASFILNALLLSTVGFQVPEISESLKVGVGVVIEPPLSFLQETKATIKTDKKIRNNF